MGGLVNVYDADGCVLFLFALTLIKDLYGLFRKNVTIFSDSDRYKIVSYGLE